MFPLNEYATLASRAFTALPGIHGCNTRQAHRGACIAHSPVPGRIVSSFRSTKSAWVETSVCRLCTKLISPIQWVPGDMRHTFISRLAENPSVSEQTIKALAGHVSRQMLERYSHIRSQAKHAAIQALEHPSIEPILHVTGHKIGHSDANGDNTTEANLTKTNSGPGRIRTYDQRIMSPLL